MSEARNFTVRPFSKQPRSDLKDAFRILLSSSSLAALKLRAGDVCNLHPTHGPSRTAIAWTAAENLQNTVVQTSRTLQDCYAIKPGEKISISKVYGALDDIESIYLVDCSDSEKLSRYGELHHTDRNHWEWALEFPLSKCEALVAGLTFELELKGQRRSFRVTSIRSQKQDTTHTLFRYTEDTKVIISRDSEVPEEATRTSNLQVQLSGLGGMTRQIEKVNESLTDFSSDTRHLEMPPFYEHSRGILIYGPKGTGKTTLLRQIEAAGWRKTFNVGTSTVGGNAGDAENRLRNIFREAMHHQPSVIVIDQLEFVAPRRSTAVDSSSLASVLCESLDMVKKALVLVVAGTRHPNDVDDALRTPHRLAIEIELQVPTAQDRAEIIRAIRGPSSDQPNDTLIDMIAEKTHGYVGADIFALLQVICRKARQRQTLDSHLANRLSRSLALSTDSGDDIASEEIVVPLEITEYDCLSALHEVRPTAMREVFLETPKVRWTDIGGQHDIKKRLQKAVERPLKFPERMKRLNVHSKKGILLYGPPGCSKTLTVKALATEAGLNFLAVKGAEILSMYVGESERSLREIFRKARSARPSIIFFDEIDAIASKRSSTAGGVNVLTTLLNEMDGIEELRNVLVVAATNKPDVIDPALMRPGRLDNILYIGPPDFEARREILSIWFGKSIVHPEVCLDDLALRTDGYSGAELVSICETAGDAALDEEEDTGCDQEVRWKHFEYALGQVKRQITDDVVEAFELWGKASEM